MANVNAKSDGDGTRAAWSDLSRGTASCTAGSAFTLAEIVPVAPEGLSGVSEAQPASNNRVPAAREASADKCCIMKII